MDILQIYTLATSTFLTLQALPHLLTPTLLLTLLSHAHDPTDLEIYLSRALSFPLLTLAVLTLLLSGAIPLSGSASPDKKPYAAPMVTATMAFHAASAFYAYMQYASTGHSVFTVGIAGYGGLAAVGLWCLMFGMGGSVSRRTGADKRTSGFPFSNVEAEKKKAGRRRI